MCRTKIFDPMLPDNPNTASIPKSIKTPSQRSRMCRSSGLHPTHVLAIIHMPEKIYGRLSNNNRHAENRFSHSIIPKSPLPEVYIIA